MPPVFALRNENQFSIQRGCIGVYLWFCKNNMFTLTFYDTSNSLIVAKYNL